MPDAKRIAPDVLKGLVEGEVIDELSTEKFVSFYVNDLKLNQGSATTNHAVDPRSEEAIIYNPSRADRPHDYPVTENDPSNARVECPICSGDTTGVLDLAALSDGFTFINKNLYPVITPPHSDILNKNPQDIPAWGIHLVQWTSSYHDRDWHNMPVDDCFVVMSRLAAAEKTLVRVGKVISKKVRSGESSPDDPCYVSIIKNTGAAVGGSLEHGHQQIILGNLAPRRILNNNRFLKRQGITFSEYSLQTSPPELLIRDYGSAVLLVSEFMGRPYEMILALKDSQRSYLHELNHGELLAISKGWKDATSVFQELMPKLNRELAYNVVTHNGPGAGLYFEFLPYTQERGGFEHLGLTVCQADPYQNAEHIRNQLEKVE